MGFCVDDEIAVASRCLFACLGCVCVLSDVSNWRCFAFALMLGPSISLVGDISKYISRFSSGDTFFRHACQDVFQDVFQEVVQNLIRKIFRESFRKIG